MSEPLDETNMTEITIQPDGRIYVFGASLPILQILQSLQPNDPRISAILGRAKPADALQRGGPQGRAPQAERLNKKMLDSQEART